MSTDNTQRSLFSHRTGRNSSDLLASVRSASTVLSVTASSMRHQVGLAGETALPSQWARLKTAAVVTDSFGLLLLLLSFALLLSPPTLVATASGGWANPSMIAMMTLGGVFFLAWVLWEWKGATHPLMPMRVLNKTFLICVAIVSRQMLCLSHGASSY